MDEEKYKANSSLNDFDDYDDQENEMDSPESFDDDFGYIDDESTEFLDNDDGYLSNQNDDVDYKRNNNDDRKTSNDVQKSTENVDSKTNNNDNSNTADTDNNDDSEKYKANNNVDNLNNNSEESPKDSKTNQNNPQINQNNQQTNQRGPQNDKNDNTKDRVDKAKEKGKQKGLGRNNDSSNGKSDNIKNDPPADKKDNSGKPANKKNDSTKKLAEKIKDKKNTAMAKRDIALNKTNSVKAMWFAMRHPIQYAKSMGGNFLKNLITKFPIQCAVVFLIVFILLTAFMLILAFAGEPGLVREYNKYDYNQFTVTADGTEFSLDGYTLSAIYLEFFVRHNIHDYSYLTDEQFKNAISVYAIFTKVTALKNGVFDGTTGDYTGEMPNNENSYPAVCDAFVGCEKEGILFPGWKWYHSYPRDDDSIDEEKKQYKGLFSYEPGSYEDKRSQLALDAVNRVNGLIAAPEDQNGIIERIDDSFHVPRIGSEGYEWIIETAKTGMDYETMIKEYFLKDCSDDDSECKKKNVIKLYNVYDYIIDNETVYFDTGAWWPIGGSEIERETVDGVTKSFARGIPNEGYISSRFGYRMLDGGPDYHTGIDIAGIKENVTPIIAALDGTVKKRFCQGLVSDENCKVHKTEGNNYSYGGCQIWISHGSLFGAEFITKYLHMYDDSIDDYVNEGDKVTRGQVIGRAGTTGCSSGTHLHFEIQMNGKAYNPLGIVSENNMRSKK